MGSQLPPFNGIAQCEVAAMNLSSQRVKQFRNSDEWHITCIRQGMISSFISPRPDARLEHPSAKFVPALFRIIAALIATLCFVGAASAQEQPRPALNQYTTWFSGQFANAHSFSSDTDNSRMYQLESRYSRLVYARGPVAVRWVAEIVPATLVGDPHYSGGHRHYAYGGGGSPIGAQLNWVHYRRFEPFITAGGGALYFNKKMMEATHFNFTAQWAAGVQLFSSSRKSSFDAGFKYHHISNANLGNVNHGMDSLMLFVGVSFFR